MSIPTNPRIAALLAVPLLALGLVACGGESETAEPTDGTATAELAATDAETAAATPTGSDTDTGSEATADTSDAGAVPAPSDYLGSYTLADEEFGTMVTVTVADGVRTIQSNSLPDHETGEFPNAGNPNTISEQDLGFELTTNPLYTGDATFAQQPGVAVNGVAFEPGTAEQVTCESGESVRIEAIQDLHNLGLDFNNAHVQPTGQYHYHGVSELLVEAYASDQDLVHVGFAADGHLMYFSKSGAYESGYVLSTETRTGTECVATGPDNETFDLEGTTPDGAYNTDWSHDPDAGDLDSCNGTTIDGQYVYLVTEDYPYIPRCLNGEFTATGPGAGGTPDLSEAAATLGITENELLAALGGPPPDLDAAAATLGVTVAELEALMPGAGASQG